MNHFRRSFPALMFYLLYINSVTCQEVIYKVGEDALLPCVYEDPVPDNVFWRINVTNIVFNIINKQPSTTGQFERYENRVSSFPEEYEKGNFSIKIKKLEVDDTNVYKCSRPDKSNPRTVKLIVSDIKPLGGAAASNLPSVVLLFATSLLICF